MLTPRPAEIAAWDSLSDDQKRLYSRQMEVYAGFLAYTDNQLGRLVRALQQAPGGDNTLIFYIAGDNGPSAFDGPNGSTNNVRSVEGQLELLNDLGGPNASWNNYAAGWAWFGSTPFQYWKSVASHFGGLRAPLVVSWPGRVQAQDRVRFQFTHVNDIAATIYDAAGVRFPSVIDGVRQEPLDGVSFLPTFGAPDAPARHRTQYFEIMGNRGIYHDGWMASAAHWVHGVGRPLTDFPTDFRADRWELYDLARDFSQAHDLAAAYPARLTHMRRLFDREARSNDVFPLVTDFLRVPEPRRESQYFGTPPRWQTGAGLGISGRSFRITAQTEIAANGRGGVIFSAGRATLGFVLYVNSNGELVAENVRFGHREVIRSSEPLGAGPTTITFEFLRAPRISGETAGVARLWTNGVLVASGSMSSVFMTRGSPFGIGREYGAISNSFEPPFPFDGTLESTHIELLD